MQEETIQLQKKQVIEYTHRKIIKPLQRKCQSNSQNTEDFYQTQESYLDSDNNSIFCKRGTDFSIEEEYHPQILQNPLANELPNFAKWQNQLNHTIQQQPEITYVHTDMFKNEHSNLKDSEYQQEPQEDSIGVDYKLIQVDDINYLQTFQSNILENQKQTLRDKKLTPKIPHQNFTKGIHKILIKK